MPRLQSQQTGKDSLRGLRLWTPLPDSPAALGSCREVPLIGDALAEVAVSLGIRLQHAGESPSEGRIVFAFVRLN